MNRMGIANPLYRQITDFVQNLPQGRIESIITIGRQSIKIDAPYFERRLGVNLCSVHSDYCEPYFELLGLSIDSIDYSSFEGATYTANFCTNNHSRFAELKILGKYDLVLDSGSSEHMISPIISIWNQYLLCKDGGFIYLHLPVSGWQNHGLYRFTPTFFSSIQGNYLRLVHYDFVEQLPNSPPESFFRYSETQRLPEELQMMSHVIYQKLPGMDFESFCEGTLQDIYKQLK
jgi:hypothetical protein